MAVITKIRNQSALLIGAIGIAMLLFIVGGDFLTSSGRFMSGGQTTDIAVIGGEPIPFEEFHQRLEAELIRNYGSTSVEAKAREAVKNRLWTKLLHEKILFDEYEALGLGLSPEELFYQIKSDNPSPILTQFFTNPQTGQIYQDFIDPRTGGINPDKVVAALQQVLNDPQGVENWLAIEEAIKLDRLSTKYHNLVKKGLYVTTWEAKKDYKAKNTKASFRYVVKKYNELDDKEVEVTDADLKAYYNKHKAHPFYQQEDPTRSIDYVVFEAKPSATDSAQVLEGIQSLVPKFEKTKEDTLFINQNADQPVVNYFRESALPGQIDSLAMNAEEGAVFGPYIEDGAYKLAKVLGFKSAPDSVKARHILIKMPQGDTAAAKAKADSLKRVIQSGGDFAAIALEVSEDPGSAREGGSLGWFTEGAMVKPFNDACFDGEPGDMPIVTSQFGVHLIEIEEQTEDVRKVLLGIIDRKITPGKETYDKMFNKASTFSINNNTTEKFKAAGNDVGIRKAEKLKETDKNIAGLEAPRELIRWAFQAETGKVSEPFEMGDQFVVAHLNSISKKGTLPLDNEMVQQRVRNEVVKEKKAEKFIEEMKQYESLEQLADALGKNVESVDDLSFSAYSVPGVGGERKLIGKIFALPQGQISEPIEGKNGVYMVVVDQLTEAGEAENLASNKQQIERNYASRADYEVFNTLKEEADVVDNRPKFY